MQTPLLSDRPEEEQDPATRFFFALAGAGLLLPRDWSWEGKYGTAFCPSCGEHKLWHTDEDGDFRFGCKEQCDRAHILKLLGLDGYDLVHRAPKWLVN